MNISAAIIGIASLAAVGAAHKEYQYQHEIVPQIKAGVKLSHKAIEEVRNDTVQVFKDRAKHLEMRHKDELLPLPKEGIFVHSPSPESVGPKVKLHKSRVGLEEPTKKRIEEFLEKKKKAVPSKGEALANSH